MNANYGPEGLVHILSSALKNLDFERRIREQTCLLLWDEIVGDKVSDAAQPEFVRDGKLFVTAKSSVWANELTFYKPDIISKMNKRLGSQVLTEIIFKPGKVKKKKPEVLEQKAERPDLEGIELSKAELDSVDKAISSAGEAGESLKHLMITSLRVEKWKKSQGWTPCKRCGSLQNTANGICPPCKIK